ncbi:MAG TPA: hypothetical protein VEI73_00885 [Candidatus Acidoferrum sp.]|nr:hypothetical protein [Candidatus Acidoferrum sp.]
MTKCSFRMLKPNVTQDEALRTFSAAGFSALYWRMRSGPLRRIADVYVPYFLFQVKCGNGRPRLFAIDAVDGSLDLFEFPRVPSDQEVLLFEKHNRIPPVLSEARAAEILRDKVLRVIFQQGFFKLRDARLDITPTPCKLHLPYWLGFHERGGVVRCRAMDAVRRRVEGAKASAFFEHWLAA